MSDSERTETTQLKAYTWLVFAGFGGLFVVYGIYALTLLYLEPDHWRWLSINTEATDYIGGTFRWLGLVAFGFGVLTIAIAYGGFRQGDRWAWYGFLVYPVFFLVAIPVTWPGLMWIPFVLVSIAALWIGRPASELENRNDQ